MAAPCAPDLRAQHLAIRLSLGVLMFLGKTFAY